MSAAAKATEKQRGPNGGHLLTTEDRRRGAERAAEVKRERSKTIRERMAEATEEHFQELLQVLLDGIAEGQDIDTRRRSLETWLDQAFGRPSQAITGKDGGPIEVEHSDVSVAKERFVESVDELAERRSAKTG